MVITAMIMMIIARQRAEITTIYRQNARIGLFLGQHAVKTATTAILTEMWLYFSVKSDFPVWSLNGCEQCGKYIYEIYTKQSPYLCSAVYSVRETHLSLYRLSPISTLFTELNIEVFWVAFLSELLYASRVW